MSEEQAQYAAALTTQVGGNHYKDMPIQPVEYIHKNGIGYFEGCVIKYVSRWRKKNGVEDLKKARHFLDLLIEFESARPEIQSLGLDERTISVLAREGIYNVCQLLGKSDNDFLRIPNMGQKSMNAIREKLALYGYE